MYIRNYNDPRRAARRTAPQTSREQKEASDFLPPDYGGVAYDRQAPFEDETGEESPPSGTEQREEGGEETESGMPRFPLMFGGKTEERSVRAAQSSGGKSMTVEDLLLCALIMLMLDAGADDDILLILGFLLIAGLRG